MTDQKNTVAPNKGPNFKDAVVRLRVLYIAYGFLLLGTGYIAFFQPQFNPAIDIDEQLSALIDNENTREFTLISLKEEGMAFKARRELAVQSFNIVLGAALGFLSATATQLILKPKDKDDQE